ncbi:GNAT family N-acetyltransferase [Streptomyces sp. ms191]|uniref:GNAT family N-acetyltransferase n=1 Tax=Streptomyces sp. ms191 TaxID=1827978 RepID=UPI0011CDF4BB|nr:GNAT family N-acetyltransferase [Streptomyces sp. ms191]TXS30806.1 GNAT family N-acetyltransferase [Streptomyces sp. ms191]
MSLRTAALGADEAHGLRDELIALCAQAFCGAPWHEPPRGALRTVERLLGRTGAQGFRWVAAFDGGTLPADGGILPARAGAPGGTTPAAAPGPEGVGGALAGFAAGWSDHALSGADDTFELAELVVAPAYQGRGLGRALHDALLDRAPAPRLLMTLDVPELRDRYVRWGWRVVERRLPEKDPRPFVVMRHG